MKYKVQLTDVISSNNIESVFRLIEESKQILITTHLSPDGDALGSSLALYNYLLRIGKNVQIIVPNSFPYFLRWMHGSDQIKIYEYNPEAAQKIIETSDLIFSLDYNIPKRIGDMGEFLEKAKGHKVLIDHHLYPGEIFDIVISHPPISSTSELVFRLFFQGGKYDEMTSVEAECIYTGMMTDTGGFTFNSNDAEIFQIISLLLRKGIDKDAIYAKVYNNMSESRFRLLGFTLMHRMKIYPELHSALIYLSKEDQKQFDISKGDTEGFVNYPLGIKDIIFSTFIREDDNLVKMSFRSQNRFPCNEFAANHFGGGGHLNASGGEFYGELSDAIEHFEKNLVNYAEKLKEEANK